MRTIEITNQQFEMLENVCRQNNLTVREALNLLLKKRAVAEKSRSALLKVHPKAKPMSATDEKLIDDAVHQSRTRQR